MKKKTQYLTGLLASVCIVALPLLSFAANDASTITSWFGIVGNWVNMSIPILLGIAILVFIWGLIGYINAGDDDTKKKAARGTIIYGVIILAAIVGVWGLVALVLGTLGVNTTASFSAPAVPGTSGAVNTSDYNGIDSSD